MALQLEDAFSIREYYLHTDLGVCVMREIRSLVLDRVRLGSS